MSRKLQIAATLLLLVTITHGSLQALPSAPRLVPAHDGRGDFLTMIVEWIASRIAPAHPKDIPPPASQPKEGSIMDPDGHH